MLPHVSWIQSPDRKNAAEVTDEGEVYSGASSTCPLRLEQNADTFLQTRYGD